VAALDDLPRASFARIEIPYENRSIQGTIRDYHHEYPHAPGADPEKLGRRLYVVRLSGHFDRGMHHVYADLYPNKLNQLSALFEQQKTDALLVPGMGTIQAYCRNWTRDLDVQIRSGEHVSLEFVEDRSADYVFDKLTARTVATAQRAVALTRAEVDRFFAEYNRAPAPMDLFDALEAAVSSMEGIRDQAELAGNLLAAKAEKVVDLCSRIEKLIVEPPAYPVLQALKTLWAAASDALSNTLSRPSPSLGTYTVERRMTIQQASWMIYGTTARSSELLQINDLEDPMWIAAGTSLRYYVDAPAA
jgi:hypothetical protein